MSRTWFSHLNTMELFTKFQQFLNLEEIVRKETGKILRPIQVEVQLQDKKFLLASPVENTLSVEWLVAPRKKQCIQFRHYYLVLEVQPAPARDFLPKCGLPIGAKSWVSIWPLSSWSFRISRRMTPMRLTATASNCGGFPSTEKINTALVAKRIMT